MRPWLTEPVLAAPAAAVASPPRQERLLNKRAMDWQSAYFMPSPADAAVIALRRWGCRAQRGLGEEEGRMVMMLLRCRRPAGGGQAASARVPSRRLVLPLA